MVSALSASCLPTSGGLHTGECVRRKGRIEGLAVEVARAIAQRGAPNELIISRTVKDLVAGTAFRFVDRGRYSAELDSGEWRIYGLDALAEHDSKRRAHP
jgi:class 3 adenylate cyclase